jgi:hypothetical protein
MGNGNRRRLPQLIFGTRIESEPRQTNSGLQVVVGTNVRSNLLEALNRTLAPALEAETVLTE